MLALDDPGMADAMVRRLLTLTPDTNRRWGTMTPHEMICHLTDSYRTATGEHEVSHVETLASRTIVRLIALHTPLPWPQGVPTRPEVDPKRQGTRPDDFARDRDRLAHIIRTFAEPRDAYSRHPFFGSLSRREWMLWGYRHADHHFRQFGI
jgi:hypothetical protein